MEEFALHITEAPVEEVTLAITEQTERVSLEVNEMMIAANGLPAGGTAGQVLVKRSEANHHAEWQNLPKHSGFAYYRDTEYTQANPLRVEANVWTLIPNNALSVYDDEKPDGIDTFFDPDTQRMVVQRAGTGLAFRIDLGVIPTVSSVRCKLGIDIGGTQGVFVEKRFMVGAAAVPDEYSESITPAFGGATFEANGGQVKLWTPHPIDIYGAGFLIAQESVPRA